MVQSNVLNAIPIGNSTYLCRAMFSSITSSIFFSEDGVLYPFSRQVDAAFTSAHLSTDPEVCIVAENCLIIFTGNFSGNQVVQKNHYIVDGCKALHQSLECLFIFHSLGSATIKIEDDVLKFSTQIMVVPRLSAQFWPTSVLRSERLRVFVAFREFSLATLYSKIFNNTVKCFHANDGNFSHVFECDFRHISMSESFPIFVGPSPRALQSIGSIQVLSKPEIFAVVPLRAKANYPQTISIVGHNFDASMNISCSALGHVTTASILNSKNLICPNMIFPCGNVTLSIRWNELDVDSYAMTAASAPRV
jgi:hypothetical protein